MKKVFLSFIALTCHLSFLSAQAPIEAATFVPKTVLPSPEAFSFTKYGDIPVGLFSGTMNYSIPLFQLRSGKINVPVSLGYASNGVKVNGVAGRTGTDWTLQSGGVITRTIQGTLDGPAGLEQPPADSSSWDFYNYMKNTVTGFGNTQPDEFSYNFQGYSGKFYFDYAGNIRELSPSGLIITTNTGKDYFTVTTQDGTKYHFAAIDQTYNYSLFGDNSAIGANYGGVTAWYLSKIKNVYNDSIEYKYSGINNDGRTDYISDVSQTMRYVPAYHFDAQYIIGSNYSGDFAEYRLTNNSFFIGCLNSQNATLFNTDVKFTSMFVAKLDEIVFKEGSLKFYYSSRQDMPYEQKLDSLELVSKFDNKKVKTVKLEYVYSEASTTYYSAGYISPQSEALPETYPYLMKRLFLDKLKIADTAKVSQEIYGFEYDAMNDLPPRLSFAQDYFGYSNGKMNTVFVPDNTMFSYRANFTSLPQNRGFDSAHSRKGLLKKINYPTGGFSEIKYEANQLGNYKLTRQEFDTVTHTINYTSTQTVAYSDTFTMDNPYQFIFSAEGVSPADPNAPQLDSIVLLSFENISDNTCVYFCDLNISAGTTVSRLDNMHFLLKGRTYRLKLESQNTGVKAMVKFIQYHIVDDSITNYVFAGNRVAAVVNYTATGKQTGYKKYSYLKPGTSFSTGGGIIQYNDSRDFCYVDRIGGCGDEYSVGAAQFVITSSSNIGGGYTTDYAAVNYEYVTEFYDSLETEGKIVTQFKIGANKLPSTFTVLQPNYVTDHSPFIIPGAPLTNTGYMHGKELAKTVYEKRSGNFRKIKETNSFYSTDSRLLHVDSFYLIRRVMQRTSYNSSWKYFGDYDINEYKRISAWVHLDSTVDKQYDLNNTEIITKTMYAYGNSSHLLPTLVQQVNSIGDTVKKVTQYTDDLRQLNPGNTILTQLYNNNMTNIPMVNKQYSNSNLLSTATIEYNSSLLPYQLKTARRNNTLESEAEYTQYDSQANPREFSVKGQKSAILTDTTYGVLSASCSNASIDDIAYTSFETAYPGNWSGINFTNVKTSYAVTGKKYLNQTSFSISKASLNSSTKYTVTYWSRNGSYTVSGTQSGYPKQLHAISIGLNTWTLFEHLVTGQTTITVSGSGAIDELRLHPSDGSMKSYTYLPLYGILTQADATNRVTYYEYDAMGRLSLLRDMNWNIIKRICYGYQGQTVNCEGNISPDWQSTSSIRCKPCASNGAYTINMQQHEERDMNPQSSSYNTTRWVDDNTAGSCAISADWQNTVTAVRCQKNGSNENTGYQEQEQKDLNPCSATYNTLRWVVTGYNATSCPLPPSCNFGNCTSLGPDKRCVGGVCETGVKVYTASYYNSSTGMYECTYHYEWSDSVWSSDLIEYNIGDCPIW